MLVLSGANVLTQVLGNGFHCHLLCAYAKSYLKIRLEKWKVLKRK